MTYTTAYAKLRTAETQAAYARRVKAFGLPALLAPYSVRRVVRIPSQRSGQ